MIQAQFGEEAELVDATREFGTLLFTGLEIQWSPLYRFESDLLHKPLEECKTIALKPLQFTGCLFKCTADTTERSRRAVKVLL